MLKHNNIMRKRLAASVLSAAILAMTFTGCNGGSNGAKTADTADSSSQDDKISVVATIFPQYDFARQVAGELADITMLLSAGEESHTYEPTPQDIITIQNADVFIYVGGESDSWVDDILASMDTTNMKIVNMMNCVDVVEEELVEGMEDVDEEDSGESDETQEDGENSDSEEDEEEPEYDEHVWTSVENAQIITQEITDALCQADRQNENAYRSSCAQYLSELSQLKKEIESVVENADRNVLIFGDRFPMRYFTDEFGLEYYAAFPGCAEQTEPSAGTVAFLIEKTRDEGVPVVLYMDLSSGKVAETIAESTDTQTAVFYSCHNVSKEDFDNGVTYVELMERNIEVPKIALYDA